MLPATPKAIGVIHPFVSFVVKSLVLGFVLPTLFVPVCRQAGMFIPPLQGLDSISDNFVMSFIWLNYWQIFLFVNGYFYFIMFTSTLS